MSVQTITLLSTREIADGTQAFIFQRPDNFDFKAGQSADFTLVNPPESDGEGNTRAFSIASAPHEANLMIATRMRNTAFKRVLKSMAIGSKLTIDGPFGSMTLHNNASKTGVLLAGGIGITPFRSMAFRAAHERLAHKLFLFSSNHNPESTPFLEELRELEHRNTNFHFIPTVNDGGSSHTEWSGERGHIDASMLSRYLTTLQGPVYYIAGPPSLVSAMQTMLNEAGVNDDDIRSEAFSGY